MCKVSGSNSQKRRGHLDFCAVKCKNHGLASLLLSLGVYSILGAKFDLIVVLCSQFSERFRETLYEHALEHLEAARPDKKWVIFLSFFFLPTVNAYFEVSIFDIFEGLWSGQIFGASASPRSFTKKKAHVTLFHYCSWRSA